MLTLEFVALTTETLPELDFTESDSTDPLGINEFYKKDLQTYQKSKLSTVWIAKQDKKIVAYFATSMNAIDIDKLSKNEKVEDVTTRKYPAMLLGRMGVNKKDRGNNFGKDICIFCIGLACDISSKIGCRYVMLDTTLDKASFYEKIGFVRSVKAPRHGIVTMYRRLFD